MPDDDRVERIIEMTALEIMEINEEMRLFFEEIPPRRILIKNIMERLTGLGNEVIIEYQRPCYDISIKHGDKTRRMTAFEAQSVLDMLYAITMYI